MWYNQFELFDKIQNNQLIIFHKKITGKVICLGKYGYESYKKKMAFNGMTYFEIILYRKNLLIKKELPIMVKKDSYPSMFEDNFTLFNNVNYII